VSSEHTHNANCRHRPGGQPFCCGAQGAIGSQGPCSRPSQSFPVGIEK